MKFPPWKCNAVSQRVRCLLREDEDWVVCVPIGSFEAVVVFLKYTSTATGIPLMALKTYSLRVVILLVFKSAVSINS